MLGDNPELEALLPRTHCPIGCDGRGTYADLDDSGEPIPAQCQWCYEVVIPLREGVEALMAKAAEEGEIAVARKVLAVSGGHRKLKGFTQTKRLQLLTDQCMKIIGRDDDGIQN